MSEEKKLVVNPEDIKREVGVEETTIICEKIGISFEEIKELAGKKKTFGALEKEIKDKTEKIKYALLAGKIKKGDFGGTKLSITIQNRDQMDEDKLVELLKSKGLEHAIITIEQPDPNKLPQLIADGLLNDEEIKKCMIPNKVYVLNFPRTKKSTNTETKTESKINIPVNDKKEKLF